MTTRRIKRMRYLCGLSNMPVLIVLAWHYHHYMADGVVDLAVIATLKGA